MATAVKITCVEADTERGGRPEEESSAVRNACPGLYIPTGDISRLPPDLTQGTPATRCHILQDWPEAGWGSYYMVTTRD